MFNHMDTLGGYVSLYWQVVLLYNDLGFKFKKESWQTALIGKTRRITETEAIFMSAHVGENFRYKNTDLIDTCNLHALTIDVSLKYCVLLLFYIHTDYRMVKPHINVTPINKYFYSLQKLLK